jgi:hypothetical protein
MNCRLAKLRQRIDHACGHRKVITPYLSSRIEQGDNLARVWVNRGYVRSLESITVETGQREILKRGSATVFLCYDVIYLVCKEGVRL